MWSSMSHCEIQVHTDTDTESYLVCFWKWNGCRPLGGPGKRSPVKLLEVSKPATTADHNW